jgi:hypothetical protein
MTSRKTTTVSERAIRDLVREAFENKELAKTVMDPFAVSNQINPVVSPARPYDQPLNPDFTPQDKPEFVVAMQKAVGDVEDSNIPKLYRAIIDALEEFEADVESQIKRDTDQKEEDANVAAYGNKKDERNMDRNPQDEARVRAAVRNILIELASGKKDTRVLKEFKSYDEWLEDYEKSHPRDPEPESGTSEWNDWEARALAWKDTQEEEEEDAPRPRTDKIKNITTDVPLEPVLKAAGFEGSYSSGVAQFQKLLTKYADLSIDPERAAATLVARTVLDFYLMYLDQLKQSDNVRKVGYGEKLKKFDGLDRSKSGEEQGLSGTEAEDFDDFRLTHSLMGQQYLGAEGGGIDEEDKSSYFKKTFYPYVLDSLLGYEPDPGPKSQKFFVKRLNDRFETNIFKTYDNVHEFVEALDEEDLRDIDALFTGQMGKGFDRWDQPTSSDASIKNYQKIMNKAKGEDLVSQSQLDRAKALQTGVKSGGRTGKGKGPKRDEED